VTNACDSPTTKTALYNLDQCFSNFFDQSPLFTLDTSLSPPKPDKANRR